MQEMYVQAWGQALSSLYLSLISIREQILEYQNAANNERNNYFYGGNYYRQPNKKNVVDTNNYIREIFTENSEWDPEVKHINEEEIKKFEKKEERKNRYAQRKKQ